MFVPDDERPCRSAELIDAGAVAITDSWHALATALTLSTATPETPANVGVLDFASPPG
ncbi:hypothetical protein I552_1763 [Mycobacterium xenopi 3993]|nr:hypothetical protein I552_1763 [Mycobacterium xenopi 3993]